MLPPVTFVVASVEVLTVGLLVVGASVVPPVVGLLVVGAPVVPPEEAPPVSSPGSALHAARRSRKAKVCRIRAHFRARG